MRRSSCWSDCKPVAAGPPTGKVPRQGALVQISTSDSFSTQGGRNARLRLTVQRVSDASERAGSFTGWGGRLLRGQVSAFAFSHLQLRPSCSSI